MMTNDEIINKITEDYVSLETAKLLKEKGFNEVCRAFCQTIKKLRV